MVTRKIRFFNGLRYFRYAIRTTKSDARKIASQQRSEGYYVRVVRIKSRTKPRGLMGYVYEIYLRRK